VRVNVRPSMTTLRFGDRLRALRTERAWSIREASRRLGIDDYSYLRDVEQNKFVPKEEPRRRIAALYGVSPRKVEDWVVADRLTALTGEKTPGVSWFTRSLGDLSPAQQRQAIARLLGHLAKRQDAGEPWPDEFEVRREER